MAIKYQAAVVHTEKGYEVVNRWDVRGEGEAIDANWNPIPAGKHFLDPHFIVGAPEDYKGSLDDFKKGLQAMIDRDSQLEAISEGAPNVKPPREVRDLVSLALDDRYAVGELVDKLAA